MLKPKSEFVRIIQERGYLHQCTALEELDEAAAKGPITGYIGFDATASSLHVGSLVQIMLLRRLQQTGHRPIALMGGGTTKIGDPSGKDESRRLLSAPDIELNLESIKQSFAGYLDFGPGPTGAIMANNDEWLDKLNYIRFLRDFGRHFSVNKMLSFDSVKLRLDRQQNLSFLEFNYMILQAYDFLELSRRFDCRLQMGGSDQWGNIVNGVELTRRVDGKEVFGLTAPLITTGAGAKMGKTESGAVWLNARQLSEYEFWQFWRNAEDKDVGRFLRLFTDLPLAEIARLEALGGEEINQAKITLANETTRLCHGPDGLQRARATTIQMFGHKNENRFGEAKVVLTGPVVGVAGAVGATPPGMELSISELDMGVPFYELLRRTGLAISNGEARRLIKGGGARLNDEVIADENRKVTSADLNANGVVKLSFGKKRHAVMRVAGGGA